MNIKDDLPIGRQYNWIDAIPLSVREIWHTFNPKQKEAVKELAANLYHEWELSAGGLN